MEYKPGNYPNGVDSGIGSDNWVYLNSIAKSQRCLKKNKNLVMGGKFIHIFTFWGR